jgi:hypothetical protein
MPGKPLNLANEFNDFACLYLNRYGRFVEPNKDFDHMSDGEEISTSDLPSYFERKIRIPSGTTDVFVWVHGWRNRDIDAQTHGRQIFFGIQNATRGNPNRYDAISEFKPYFVAVRWPSLSVAEPLGYKRIRDRAAKLTENGEAEFFLACLLGYLESNEPSREWRDSKVLVSKFGFYVHCVGHSFGGRFLAAAIKAASRPTPKTLSLLSANNRGLRKVLSTAEGGFSFTVDTLTIFQMAAPSGKFGNSLSELITSAPLTGPLLLTHSKKDRANCLWHRIMEWQCGIGCSGAVEPKSRIRSAKLLAVDERYDAAIFSHGITNIDANNCFTGGKWTFAGAHGDFLYEESIHLLLSAVNHARRR